MFEIHVVLILGLYLDGHIFPLSCDFNLAYFTIIMWMIHCYLVPVFTFSLV